MLLFINCYNLLQLTVEDIETLKNQLPKLELLLSVPDTASITQFFFSRSSTNLRPEPPNPTASIEDRIVSFFNTIQVTVEVMIQKFCNHSEILP